MFVFVTGYGGDYTLGQYPQSMQTPFERVNGMRFVGGESAGVDLGLNGGDRFRSQMIELIRRSFEIRAPGRPRKVEK